MEWVETTGKTIEEARGRALDQLGVAEDEAEFEVLEEPKSGLFGRLRGEARVRARIRPAAVRPKLDRRGRGRRGEAAATPPAVVAAGEDSPAPRAERQDRPGRGGRGQRGNQTDRTERTRSVASREGSSMESSRESSSDDGSVESDEGHTEGSRGESRMEQRSGDSESVDPTAVGEAAVEFMMGLTTAFGTPATAELAVDGSELEVRVHGEGLGLLIGPGGRTLLAVQDLARVAAQRRLGDHETRLRVDVSGYRERRRVALEKFASAVAHDVVASGSSKALEPMSSADRKIVHDTVQNIDGVTSHSDGEEPRRRVVITPA